MQKLRKKAFLTKLLLSWYWFLIGGYGKGIYLEKRRKDVKSRKNVKRKR